MRWPLTDSLARFRVFRQSPRNKHTYRKLHLAQLGQHSAPRYWRELVAWSMPNIAKRWIPLSSVLPAVLILAAGIKMHAQAVGIASVSGWVAYPIGVAVIIVQVQSHRVIDPGFLCRRLQSHKSFDLWAGQEHSGFAHHASSTQGHLLSAVSTCTLTARACRQAARPGSNLC